METQTKTETPCINLILTDLHLDQLNSQNQSFSISDANLDYLQLQFADIEMIIMRSGVGGRGGGDDDDDATNNDNTYTSLKDLMPDPPAYGRKDSWRDIPIKDPLVQQAAWAWAWAYLPPVTAERDPTYFGKLKHGLLRCFNDVVMAIINRCLILTKSGERV